MKHIFTKLMATGLLVSCIANTASASVRTPAAPHSNAALAWVGLATGGAAALSLVAGQYFKDKVGTDSQERREAAEELKEKSQSIRTVADLIELQNDIAWADLRKKEKKVLLNKLREFLNPSKPQDEDADEEELAPAGPSALRPSEMRAGSRPATPKFTSAPAVRALTKAEIKNFKNEFGTECDKIAAANRSYLPATVLYGLTALGAGVTAVGLTLAKATK